MKWVMAVECRKCKKEIPDGSKFCNWCGTKQDTAQTRKRGNGTGTVFKGKNGTWVAECTLDWSVDENLSLKRKSRRKGGFATKKAALEYLPTLRNELPKQDANIKFKDLYNKWMDRHEERVTKSTINCYRSAFKYLQPLWYAEMASVRTEHIQKCIDGCPHGRRTKENMKALCTSLCRYAVQLELVDRNFAEYVQLPKADKTERVAFSGENIAAMWDSVGKVAGIEYILILIYTGLRLGELLSAKTADYNKDERYFIAGSKTKAGMSRTIPSSPRILPFFDDLGKGEYLFSDDGKKMTEARFRETIFNVAMDALGLGEKGAGGTRIYTPHTCRHTFATLMKNVDAPATDKQKLIGHSAFEMTAHYTHTDIESLRRITDVI